MSEAERDRNTTDARVAALEAVVRQLARDVAEMRAELQGRSARPAPPERAAPLASPTPQPPSARAAVVAPDGPASVPRTPVVRTTPPTRRPVSELDWESFVGRYGTVVLAALTITMGVGAFLVWAIAQQKLGPEARVALGAAGALATAAAGWHFRTRGARTFGNTLLALSLALVHVVAWAAGPRLHVVSEPVASVLAVAASAGLAALAYREAQQILFIVGFGAALLAPFVTSSRSGNVLLLLAYGWLVLMAALGAVRSRDWSIARRVMLAGCAGYVLAAVTAVGALPGGGGLEHRLAPSVFALACAWGALVLGGSRKSGLTRGYLVSVVLGTLSAATAAYSNALLVVALAATITVYLELREAGSARLGWGLTALALPAALLVAVLVSVPHVFTVRAGSVVLAWTVVASLAAMDASGARRGIHLVFAGFAGALAIVLPLQERAELCVAALAAYSCGLALLSLRVKLEHVLWPTFGVLVVASLWSYSLLLERPLYAYPAFRTVESAAALAVVLAWAIVGLLTARAIDRGERDGTWTLTTVAPGLIAAFLWGREELARTIAEDPANFLLILYYALCGVSAIYAGRVWRSGPARKVGLALSIFAALKALVQASGFDAIGLRVGSYLLVGGFLLAVGYWYRATADDPEDPPGRQDEATGPTGRSGAAAESVSPS